MKLIRNLTFLTCLLGIFQSATVAASPGADIIFYGGPVLTVNSKNEEVQALAVQGGKIVAVGTKAAVSKRWQTDTTQLIDLKGQTLMPGFVEPHIHIIGTALSEGLGLNLSNFTLPYDTLDTIEAKLRARLSSIPAGGWLFAFGVDPSRTSPFMAELTANDLDKVSTTVPIFIINQSGHIGYVNHKALELAGVTESTANPSGGGVYVKDAQGKLTGKLIEPPSFTPFMAKMPAPPAADLIKAIKKTTTQYIASAGVTTSAEITVGFDSPLEEQVKLYKDLAANEGLPIRVRAYLYGPAIPAGYDGLKPNEGDDRLRFIGVKFISDGSTQGLTAALNQPYDYPSNTSNRGTLDYGTEDLYQQMKIYFDQGWQIAVHANGDSAIDQTLNNYEELLAGNAHPEERRLRIEHFTINTPEQVKKAVKLGVIPGFTIGHVDYWGGAFHNHIVGPERANRIDPSAAFKKEGGRFAYHSDSPVSNVSPLNYISEGAGRLWQKPPREVLGPDQRVTVDDAIRAVTINAAYEMFSDDKIGSLEVGKQADLVILGANPRTTPVDQIRNIKVQETWIDGKKQSW
ncbi:putative amidohydrolase YtcJ [Polynucleobacter sphagniphilus]|uniref:amidohydrolase n=1 Tax=Polynucleobacter sphagniphilus TaxID=1743169 RepID=UPI002474B886|nr:amidohydrolase [Polynucleobacter sphagniphilus]MDH6421886.1 putative amidohydrolase YtcJ [Polynucleobacter sphagniphilus]